MKAVVQYNDAVQRCVRIDYTLNQISAVFLSIHLISTQLLNQIIAVFLSIHLISTEKILHLTNGM